LGIKEGGCGGGQRDLAGWKEGAHPLGRSEWKGRGKRFLKEHAQGLNRVWGGEIKGGGEEEGQKKDATRTNSRGNRCPKTVRKGLEKN